MGKIDPDALNFYQTDPAGSPSGSQTGNKSYRESGENSKNYSKKKSGTANGSVASHGGKNKAADPKKTDLRNYRVGDSDVNHGNIDEKTEYLVNYLIKMVMQNQP